MTSVKWRGREVENPILRKLVGVYAIVMATFGMVFVIVFFVIVMPLSYPFHLLLRVFGRKGFVEWDGRNFSYNIGKEGFKRA
jgi:hypothetical protein